MKRYALIKMERFSLSDFEALDGIAQDSYYSIRRSRDGRYGIVSWSGEHPLFPNGCQVKEFSHKELKEFVRRRPELWEPDPSSLRTRVWRRPGYYARRAAPWLAAATAAAYFFS